MELEELKNQWAKMSEDVDNKKLLSDTAINKMTEMNFRKKINKIKYSEITGSVICVVTIIFIIMGIKELEPWYLKVCAIVSICMLIFIPALSLRAIIKVQSIDLSANTYKQTLSAYHTNKIHFINVQKISLCLAALLFISVLPVIAMLTSDKDMFQSNTIWYIYSVGFPFLYLFATWVAKKYKKSLDKAQNMLNELSIQ